MIDASDTRTIDAFADLPKRRGRPPTGRAMTAAQRKRAQRQRDVAAVRAPALSGCDFLGATLTGLCEHLASAVSEGDSRKATLIAGELIRRAELNESSKDVTVTKKLPQ